jgi:hypothetical protein
MTWGTDLSHFIDETLRQTAQHGLQPTAAGAIVSRRG